jgi:hypothetical protein
MMKKRNVMFKKLVGPLCSDTELLGEVSGIQTHGEIEVKAAATASASEYWIGKLTEVLEAHYQHFPQTNAVKTQISPAPMSYIYNPSY